MESQMKEVTVASLGLDKASSSPVVILKEKTGERLLPIWIGPGEASSIAMELAGIRFSRPLTHDLFNTVVRGLNSSLIRVLITKVVENTYFASLIFQKEDEVISIDSRPSDSIALALRANAPIFADEALLELTALEVEEVGFEDSSLLAEASGTVDELEQAKEDLKEYLKGLNPEDFGRFQP